MTDQTPGQVEEHAAEKQHVRKRTSTGKNVPSNHNSFKMTKLQKCLIFALLTINVTFCEQEIWEKDASNDVYIEASREGFENVKLTCLEDRMEVEVNLEEDFDGVFYTRGSYGEAKPPCYYDADGGKTVNLKFGFDECKTKESDDGKTKVPTYSNDKLLMFFMISKVV